MLPLKLRHGDNLATLFDRFNAVIDYLARTRIVAGSGIRVSQLPAGTIVESLVSSGGGGGTAASAPSGMFRVTEHPDGTVSVTGGLATLGWDLYTVADVTLTRTAPATQSYILLQWAHGENPVIAFSSSHNGGYIPGEQVCWPLARLTYGSVAFAQLWQGGMVDFSVRYYVG